MPIERLSVSSPDSEPNEPEREPQSDPPQREGAGNVSAGEGGDVTPAENKNFQRIVELLPPEDRAAVFAIIRQQTMSHSGWLPTPAFMREYEAVLPGLAERIVALPEQEQRFRHNTTKDVIKRDYSLRSRGQWMGMTALILLLFYCVFLAAWGASQASAWVAGTVIIGTVGIFVTGQLTGNKSTSKDVLENDEVD